jgi:hypothetical protein
VIKVFVSIQDNVVVVDNLVKVRGTGLRLRMFGTNRERGVRVVARVDCVV